ncbi:MAG: DegT/DnrJ/EryC1/StrS family aminotransferase [Candidatus Aenigmarchaeota archaeon]|nr:DegT/DnrJ/EryC1/StrS family aminotransferase [Candidatus Aenigmarchaeota archaeon]
MENKDELRGKIDKLIDSYFEGEDEKFVPGKSKVSLQVPSYGSEEVKEVVDSLFSKFVTMGEKVRKFEGSFSGYLGSRYGTMTNSGSSANLIALSVLTEPSFKGRMMPGDEVITPGVTWITTVTPIANVGLTPVITDVDMSTYDISVESIEAAITEKTRAIMPVHLLGDPADMKRIMEIAEERDLYVIEDSCEAHGAMIGDKKIGTFGDVGTFSFYLSHHINTIEGGMVVTDNEDIHEMSRSMRVFGWIRDLKNRSEISQKYSDIDERFLFLNNGFNFRPTELQAAFGLQQIKKLDDFIDIRRETADYWNRELGAYSDYLMLKKERPGTRNVWFSYPITVAPDAPFTKNELVGFLEKNNVETRPLMTGDVTIQPVMKNIRYRKSGDLKNTKFIHNNSFLIGCHQGISRDQREYVVDVISKFIRSKVGK